MPGRVFWLLTGLVATGCGIAGVILPLVPTTPFLLLAVYAFARSSPRLHDWLLTHPRLGPPIRDWQAHGAISRRCKLLAVSVMMAALLLSIAIGVRWWVVLVQVLVLSVVAIFILTRPDASSDEA